VRLPLEIIGSNSEDATQRVDSLISLMDVATFADSYPPELSGGIQQRVNIARSLVHAPRVLLMDEPFGSLDEVTRERLNMALHRMHRLRQPTIIFVTHNLREAVFLSDRVIILSSRPASVAAVVECPLPIQRTADLQLDPQYLGILQEVRSRFFQENADQ
jgi:NitT/TauT family transport system ATP-binding protein